MTKGRAPRRGGSSLWALASQWRPLKGLGFVPCEQRRPGPAPARGQSWAQGDQFNHCGHWAGGDRARAAGGKEGVGPKPRGPGVCSGAQGLPPAQMCRAAGGRGRCRAHTASVPLCWESREASEPRGHSWLRGLRAPSGSGGHPVEPSTVRALRQSAQCPRRAALLRGRLSLWPQRADADKPPAPLADNSHPTAHRCPPGRVSPRTQALVQIVKPDLKQAAEASVLLNQVSVLKGSFQ